jgi:hypothetical protein
MLEECALLNREEHSFDVQVHDLVPPIRLVHLIEPTPPTRARVREKYVHVLRVLPDFLHQALNLGYLGTIRRNAVCARARRQVRERIEGRDGGVACRGFARRYEDFGTPGLQETGSSVETKTARAAGYDGDFSIQAEDGGKIGELDVGFGGHGGRDGWDGWMTVRYDS